MEGLREEVVLSRSDHFVLRLRCCSVEILVRKHSMTGLYPGASIVDKSKGDEKQR